jgi:hypothetical protein
MSGILGFLTGPITGLVKEIGGVIDNLTTTDGEKADAKLKLLAVQNEFQVQMEQAAATFATQQAEVIKAEVNSESYLARNWRPILMLTFTYIIAHNFVIAPVFSITPVAIPDNMWELLKIGMGGYIFGRSAEKIIPTVTEAVVAAKKK